MKSLLVRPEHFQAVEDARELFGNSSGDTATLMVDDPAGKGAQVNVEVELAVSRENPGFPFPTYVGQEVYGDPEGEPRKKLASWVKWRVKVGRDWCFANQVFYELNRRCSTPAQVRYFWPSIVGLLALSEDDKVRGKADKLRAYKPPAGIPRVEKPLAEACRSASAIIAKGLLYPETEERTSAADAGAVRLSMAKFTTPERPWDPGKHCQLIFPG
ncbi:hypothetical protein [Methylobacterium sp. 285MFTsu5.1]|uniref:hypothetical protein n=1 Tax=Methylobacterium sp. 285MFTsu5.1 TaxID=1172187 RepID=UPI00036BFA79|nr:hypothetical protein [Methylobacterium sp. 285MFTsu5.1]